YLSLNRLFHQLEIPLREWENFQAVELFDPDHARRVLALFGQAYNRLPQPPAALSPDQRLFLDTAVEGIWCQDGKVSPVQLSLFAHLMRSDPWDDVKLLSKAGGEEGIGVRFLEAIFSSRHAPAPNRLHEKAVRAVLGHLLPQRNEDIRVKACP